VGCRTVCISQSDGAGGEDVGRIVAAQLGFVYVDEEIVAQAAAKGGVSAGDVADEERRRSAVSRILDEIGRSISIDSTGLARPDGWSGEATPDLTRALIKDAIEAVASRGKAVIASHGASFALTGRSDVLRVLVTASPETRRRALEARGLAPENCQRAVRNGDAARRDYLRRFYSVRKERPTHYDLVVNTDTFTVEQAAGLVVQAAGRSA
jgi:cytidylate kinase